MVCNLILTDLGSSSETILHHADISDVTAHNYTRYATENNTGFTKGFVDQYLFLDGKLIGNTSYSYDDIDLKKGYLNGRSSYMQTIATLCGSFF